MTGPSWADVANTPPGGTFPRDPAQVNPLLGSPEAREALERLKEAERELKAYPGAWQPEYVQAEYDAKDKAYKDAIVAYQEISAAAAANAEANLVGGSPVQPAYEAGDPTHEVIKTAVTRAMYDITQMLPGMVIPMVIQVVREVLASQAAPTVPAPLESTAEGTSADKHPPSPPKYNGDKGVGKSSVDAWLLHFLLLEWSCLYKVPALSVNAWWLHYLLLEWCTLYNVPASERVANAVLALEGEAIEPWYARKHQLQLDGKDPYDWETFRADMITKYADVSPDLFVRNNLEALKQGTGSVQAYYDECRAITSQAVMNPVHGAEAVWAFNRGLSDDIRRAVAVYRDDSLDPVVMQATRMDAALRLDSTTSQVAPSSSSKKSALSAGTKRAATGTNGDAKRKKKKNTGTDKDKALYAVRVAQKLCTNCRVPAAEHGGLGNMGQSCPKPAVPATAAELDIIANWSIG